MADVTTEGDGPHRPPAGAHHVGFLATRLFTSMLLGATLVRWDRFNHGHVSFWAWLGLPRPTGDVPLGR